MRAHASAEGEQKVCEFRSLLLSLIGCWPDALSAAHLGESPKVRALIGRRAFETRWM